MGTVPVEIIGNIKELGFTLIRMHEMYERCHKPHSDGYIPKSLARVPILPKEELEQDSKLYKVTSDCYKLSILATELEDIHEPLADLNHGLINRKGALR